MSSTPQQRCAVFVNGRHLGTTPFQLDRAAAGDYRVQVECGDQPARVHVVQLGDKPVGLVVNTELDAAVVSEPRLLLRYETAANAQDQVVSHAALIGEALEVDDVVLVGNAPGVGLQLYRVRVRQRRLVACARAAPLEASVASLLQGRFAVQPWIRDSSALPTDDNLDAESKAQNELRRDRVVTASSEPRTDSDSEQTAPSSSASAASLAVEPENEPDPSTGRTPTAERTSTLRARRARRAE